MLPSLQVPQELEAMMRTAILFALGVALVLISDGGGAFYIAVLVLLGISFRSAWRAGASKPVTNQSVGIHSEAKFKRSGTKYNFESKNTAKADQTPNRQHGTSRSGNQEDPVSTASTIAVLRVAIESYGRHAIDEAKICGESDSEFAERYLTGNDGRVEDAAKQLHDVLTWRREENVKVLKTKDPSEILGCPEEVAMESFPIWFTDEKTGSHLTDKCGRITYAYGVGAFNARGLLAKTDLKCFRRYMIFRMEQFTRLSGQHANRVVSPPGGTLRKLPKPFRGNSKQFCALFDLDGFSLWTHFNSDMLDIIKLLNSVGADYYPETLGAVYVVNTPRMFTAAWSVLSGIMDPDIVAKVTILGSVNGEKSKARSKMLEVFKADTLMKLLLRNSKYYHKKY